MASHSRRVYAADRQDVSNDRLPLPFHILEKKLKKKNAYIYEQGITSLGVHSQTKVSGHSLIAQCFGAFGGFVGPAFGNLLAIHHLKETLLQRADEK